MKLQQPFLREIEWRGKRYRLNLAFDRVLSAMDLLEEQTLFEEDRVRAALGLLVRGKPPRSPELLKAIFDHFPKSGEPGGPRVFDFGQDGALIYAAFWQAYGVDLQAMRGKLHWFAFLALLEALPEDTRFSQIVDIRSRPVPAATKYNAQEIAWLLRQKARFALKPREGEGLQSALHSLMQRLIANAR